MDLRAYSIDSARHVEQIAIAWSLRLVGPDVTK
jgi:hypothetical protein